MCYLCTRNLKKEVLPLQFGNFFMKYLDRLYMNIKINYSRHELHLSILESHLFHE